MTVFMLIGGVVLLSIIVAIVVAVSSVTAAVAGEVEDAED